MQWKNVVYTKANYPTMPIFTKYEFLHTTQNKAGLKGFTEIVNENKRSSRSLSRTSIFLSHSHKDKDIIAPAVSFFRNLGIDIYVDWMDNTLPVETSGETASLIKQKIALNDKFVLLATNDAVISKWCNWELGHGDSKKLNLDKLAILPLADNNESWKGMEYLQMYPRIEYGAVDPNDYWVKYPNDELKSIKDWLDK